MNLPKDFEKYFRERWCDEDVEALIRGLDSEPQVSIRLNTRRLHVNAQHKSTEGMEAVGTSDSTRTAESFVGTEGVEAIRICGADGQVPWCPEGIYLRKRPAFTADPMLHAGAYYVQEASSMFLAHVLRSLSGMTNDEPNRMKNDESRSARNDEYILPSCSESNPYSSFVIRHSSLEDSLEGNPYSSFVIRHSSLNDKAAHPSYALDLCAAPGGKSTLLRSLLPDDCLLVSNEPVRARAQVLAENLAKWGHPNVIVTQAYAADITHFIEKNAPIAAPFDLILADVPCSGEGMMRKEEESVRQWSPAFVAECAALQRSIVADIWPALRPGGILVYSTCTFNPEEDEQNVEWIARELGAEVVTIPVDPSWGIRGDLTGGQLPCYHFLPGQVRGEGYFLAVLKKREDVKENSNSIDSKRASYVEKKKDKRKGKATKSATFEERLHDALPTLPTTLLDIPESNDISTSDKRSRHASTMPPTLPRVELSLTDAIRYLQREALTLPSDTPRGIVQVCYHGQRLGLMKNLGTRANNLYPKEWRIRSSFVTPMSIIS